MKYGLSQVRMLSVLVAFATIILLVWFVSVHLRTLVSQTGSDEFLSKGVGVQLERVAAGPSCAAAEYEKKQLFVGCAGFLE